MLLYFRGCTAREKLTSISKATERILRIAKIDYETLEDEKCCGSVLLRTGFLDDAIEQMNGNLKDFEGKISQYFFYYKLSKKESSSHCSPEFYSIEFALLRTGGEAVFLLLINIFK